MAAVRTWTPDSPTSATPCSSAPPARAAAGGRPCAALRPGVGSWTSPAAWAWPRLTPSLSGVQPRAAPPHRGPGSGCPTRRSAAAAFGSACPPPRHRQRARGSGQLSGLWSAPEYRAGCARVPGSDGQPRARHPGQAHRSGGGGGCGPHRHGPVPGQSAVLARLSELRTGSGRPGHSGTPELWKVCTTCCAYGSLRCAVLAPSPNSLLCLGRCAPCALRSARSRRSCRPSLAFSNI